MYDPIEHACPEYRAVSRRSFLGGASAAAVSAALGAAWLPRVAFAQDTAAAKDVIVSVYLRGGADGLTLCVPHFESRYYAIRPSTAVPPPSSGDPKRCIDLDGAFGLPQPLSSLVEPYQNGHLCVVHAIGADDWSRSHFDAQRWMESGVRDGSLGTGWLGRHLATSTERTAGATLRAIGLTYGLPKTLDGGPKTLPIPDPDRFDLGGGFNDSRALSTWIGRQYNRVQDLTKQAVADTRRTIAMLDRIDFAGYQAKGGMQYTDDYVGYSFKATAALLKAKVGVEAVHIDVDGWDTHADQGSTDGYMDALMLMLGLNMGCFYRDLAADSVMDYTLVVLSEFGRNAVENGSRGTDHGAGNCVLVMGGATVGGRVVRDWPGLRDDQLLDGSDLRPTMDYRDVLSEIVSKRLGNSNLNTVFPGYTPRFRGIVRA